MVKLLDIDSNTTLVKVKFPVVFFPITRPPYSNTTLVKVK